jgi:hypothetical protein
MPLLAFPFSRFVYTAQACEDDTAQTLRGGISGNPPTCVSTFATWPIVDCYVLLYGMQTFEDLPTKNNAIYTYRFAAVCPSGFHMTDGPSEKYQAMRRVDLLKLYS